ncbi:unnamed protein product [Medioppia subpectinata]|uniref:Chitin-binding type-2 domain-containing protein n=1 Tax=Medioppia subpectinata TaxID=1979941 RepID=A0A7R9Q0Z7_9ACAR|nr:unnamed protein product [Medioppia subpectinata]CAG2108664.1 unnamed protein product [Medioppia subpectinata]
MSKLLLLSLLLVSIAIVLANTPEQDKLCAEVGFCPHETDPHKYYQCQFIPDSSTWYLAEMHCQASLVWSQQHLYCDWKAQ